MMKTRWAYPSLLFLIIIFSIQALSQNKIDSLRTAVNLAAEDTTKANLLNDLSKQFRLIERLRQR